jgi:hypothetical protein
MWGRIGEGGTLLGACCGRASCGSGDGFAGPDEPTPRIVADLGMGIEQIVLKGLQMCLVQLELELQGPIGHPAAPLEHGQGLV